MAAPVNRFKQSLKQGRQTIGCWLTQGTAIAAEIAATADFDWLLIDTEHSPNDLPSVLAQLHAIAGYDASAAVRPHVGDTHVIKQILDLGCQTLIVPMVESGAQAEMLVRSMRYPPAGIRGVGGAGARATGFSSHEDYLTTADREMCLVVQIETPAGVEALDDILAVDGVDAVFIGPSDLSANYGHIGNPGAPEVVEAVQGSLDKIAASDKASGIMALDPAAAKGYLDRGVDFVAVAIDARTLALSLRALAADMRGR
ncbi:MAG: HpcH/HpaI aldolase/citrate lyase family protein [Pseudomonadota bacterium]|nr:HpcH/HpaI aldolase/citrate lyase family protein [Pseudomonadota bacterium]